MPIQLTIAPRETQTLMSFRLHYKARTNLFDEAHQEVFACHAVDLPHAVEQLEDHLASLDESLYRLERFEHTERYACNYSLLIESGQTSFAAFSCYAASLDEANTLLTERMNIIASVGYHVTGVSTLRRSD